EARCLNMFRRKPTGSMGTALSGRVIFPDVSAKYVEWVRACLATIRTGTSANEASGLAVDDFRGILHAPARVAVDYCGGLFLRSIDRMLGSDQDSPASASGSEASSGSSGAASAFCGTTQW